VDKAEALRRIKAAMREIEPGRDYVVERLRPEDAPGVARLFYAIYGEDYPVEDYYIPERIVSSNQSGEVRTVVARLDTGEIIGQTALYRVSPSNPGLFEFGQMQVVPSYRDSFAAHGMMCLVRDKMIGVDGVDGVFGEAVCHHTVSQKLCARTGMAPCGLEMALMPEGAYAKEGAAGRASCLVYARVDRDTRRQAHLPLAYREAFDFILQGLGLDREVVYASGESGACGTTILENKFFDFAGVLRCQAGVVGGDIAQRVAEVENRASKSGPAVTQFFLNAADPGAPFAAMVLREQGYFLGGLVPIWFGGDALMMQKLRVAPDFGSLRLYGDRAGAVMGHVRDDFDRAAGLRGGA
jgi:hypothetical protein